MNGSDTRTVEYAVHFRKGRHGKQHLVEGEAPPLPELPVGRIPRISRLMALAIHMDGLIEQGIAKNYVELASLSRVTRARITQIMNLLRLAPDIQEEILFLPRVQQGRDPIRERRIKPLLQVKDWRKQRTMWNRLSSRAFPRD